MKKILVLIVIFILTAGSILPSQAQKSGKLWAPFVEWSFENTSYSGNPFDVVSTATFVHVNSGTTIKTELFYNGGTTWKLRFAGTKTGGWTFSTQSSDPELNGLSGSVNISENQDVYGLATCIGNKWARMKGGNRDIETFIPQFRMGFEKRGFNWSSGEIDNMLNTYMNDEGFNGVFVFMAGYWVDINASGARFSNKNPDLQSFNILEEIIKKTHSKGGVTHIWYNGDCSRSQCVDYAFGSGGAGSAGEKRLLRYIGARLAPMPGWIMGYGYDIPEFANTSELRGWGNYLRSKMGWQHMLGARDQGGNVNYSFWPEADWYSRGNWFNGVNYSTSVSVINSNPNVPHAFDERWWKSRVGEESLRRLLWIMAMSGGISAIWGWDGDWEKNPYPHPNWFKTHFTFWEGRFLQDMVRDNNLTNGWCLKTPDNKNFIFYKEGTTSLTYDLSGMSGSQKVIAVDAKKAYAEIDLGTKSPGSHTFNAPYSSDWAIAVGEFTDSLPVVESDRFGRTSQCPVLKVCPNPFHFPGVFEFNVLKRQPASLKIFNIKGEVVSDLLDREMGQGHYRIEWNPEKIQSGMLIARLKTGSSVLTRKILILK
jgi:hypothetical protein